MNTNVSVRVSQVLVGIVLAFMVAILYRMSTDAIAVRAANDTRAVGSRVAAREAARIDEVIAAIGGITGAAGGRYFNAQRFASAALGLMRANAAIDVIDYFNGDDTHIAHIERGGAARFGPPRNVRAHVPAAVVDAVNLVLSETEVTRSPASSRAVRVRSYGHTAAGTYVFIAQPIIERGADVGTIIAQLDVRRLLLSDIASALVADRYVVDDGSGRLQASSVSAAAKTDATQVFPIRFADRVWSLTVAPPAGDRAPEAWLFGLLWLVAWIAVCVPIEAVGHISRRVQALNPSLEASVAARTKQLQASVAQLAAAKQELERQMRVRADFIGTASHELRTPATTLRALSALLSGKVMPRYVLAEEDARLINMLDVETKRLANLVDDLLEVAKADAVETPLPRSAVDLCALTRSEIASTFALGPRPVPAVEEQLPDAPVMAYADESALRRVLVNLIGNAMKFTPADGRVSVAVERAADRVRLIVADTGIGIPEKDLPHVFERFYRAARDGAETRGTGLGLSIVARLVERMGGSITIESAAGKGTTVTAEFAAARAEIAAGG
jgi:signal transduction histidine kinase